jgi:hypothetical protein
MAALSSQYDDSLGSLGEVDHVTIFHDAATVSRERMPPALKASPARRPSAPFQ